jgi:hypothetical protein
MEDRGLLGWDRRANRYDLHPIVRGVTWTGLGNQVRQGIYQTLNRHFESISQIDEQEVKSLEDLTSAIELYNTLVGLGRYDDAANLYRNHLNAALRYLLAASRQSAELLEMLFPDGLGQLPRLSVPSLQAFILNALAVSVSDGGHPGQAAALYRFAIDVREKMGDQINMCVHLIYLSSALRFSGALRESEAAARRTLLIARQLSDQGHESMSLYWLGLTLAARGLELDSAKALDRSIEMAGLSNEYKSYDDLAMRALWFGEYIEARRLADLALVYAQKNRFEKGIIYATRLQGEAALSLEDRVVADERLHHALSRARAANMIEEELPALIGLAELRRRKGDLKVARELLADVWEPAERGPYRLFHSDA